MKRVVGCVIACAVLTVSAACRNAEVTGARRVAPSKRVSAYKTAYGSTSPSFSVTITGCGVQQEAPGGWIPCGSTVSGGTAPYYYYWKQFLSNPSSPDVECFGTSTCNVQGSTNYSIPRIVLSVRDANGLEAYTDIIPYIECDVSWDWTCGGDPTPGGGGLDLTQPRWPEV